MKTAKTVNWIQYLKSLKPKDVRVKRIYLHALIETVLGLLILIGGVVLIAFGFPIVAAVVLGR